MIPSVRSTLALVTFRFQSSSAGPLNFSARTRILVLSSVVRGLNCWAILTSSSICPIVVHPSARQ